jgi:hypothetical protein
MSNYIFKVFGHRGTYSCKCTCCYNQQGKTHILEVWASGDTLHEATINALEKAHKDDRFNPDENITVIDYQERNEIELMRRPAKLGA